MSLTPRQFIKEVMTTVIGDEPNKTNITATSLMLLICGMTLGTITPEIAGGVFGTALQGFIAGIGGNLFSGAVEKLRTKRETGAALTRADLDEVFTLIKTTNFEARLRKDDFKREVRHVLAWAGTLEDLIADVPEQTAVLVIDAMHTQLDLFSVRVVDALRGTMEERFTQLDADLAARFDQLYDAVMRIQGARTQPRLAVPPAGHVFISYARADGEDLARQIHDALEADSIEAWFDRYDIKPGDEWDTTIQNAIDDCRLFVFIVTPGSIGSAVCKNEWTHALNSKKTVVIAYYKEATIPMRLNSLQYIEFRPAERRFEHAMAALRQILNAAQTPTISPAQVKQQEEHALRLVEASVQAQQRNVVSLSNMPNPLPKDVRDRFFDRVAEQTRIVNALHTERARLVSIYGRAGVGKTALACKVLGDLERAVHGSPPDAIIALSATDTLNEITFDRVLTDCAKALGKEDAERVEAARKEPKMPAAEKVAALLSALRDMRFVLLLDNLETLQDLQTGALKDDGLHALFEIVLERGGGLQILVTSRAPLKLDHTVRVHERRVPLEEGLETPYAIEMLRALDPYNTAGLRDAPDKVLASLAERVRGFPRALEAAAGYLLNAPLTGLDDLMRDPALLAVEVTPVIVQKAIASLPDEQTRVMEALALFGRPVEKAALEYLLAPFADTTKLTATLERLVASHFVAYNRATQRFSLHPVDREYCLNRIPEGSADEITEEIYTRYALNHRAAEYYKVQRKPQKEWQSIDDLAPQLIEFEYRIVCGDYDTAVRLLTAIDFDFLLLWGYAVLVIDLHERLQGKIKNQTQARISMGNLGLAYYSVGRVEEAIDCYQQALEIARRDSNWQNEGALLGNMGSAYYNLGQINTAIQYYQQQLAITQEIKDRRGEGSALGNLGLAYSTLGQINTAIEYYQQRLAIAQEIKDRRGEGSVLGNLGNAYRNLGQINTAIEYYQQRLAIAQEIKDRRGEGNALGNLGIAYRTLGQIDTAIEYYQQRLAIAAETKDKRGEGNALGNLGTAYSELGQIETAIEYYQQHLAITREIKDRNGELIAIGNLGNVYVDAQDYTKAVECLDLSITIADEIKYPRAKNYMGSYLARAHLLFHHLELAEQAAAQGRQHDAPENNHNAAAIHGVILAQLGRNGEAYTAFEDAVRHADKILSHTPKYYEALYARALAQAGLALVGEGDIQPAIADYEAAKGICNAAGVAKREIGLLEALMRAPDGEKLAAVRAALGEVPGA